jgi:predicted MFS family arabinose efflux permease
MATLTRTNVRLFAVVAGLVVANIYYNQPLLDLIAGDLHCPAPASGLLPALTQAGYATGLFLLVPLGDFFDLRKLLSAILALVTASLVVAGFARSILLLQCASYAIGIFSVVPQILLPFAASNAPDGERGRTIGTMMAGLLTGILLARTVSGFVGKWFGWRAMYFGGAAMMLAVLLLIVMVVPEREERPPFRYGDVLRSLVGLIKQYGALRETSFIGAMCFAGFSAFWSMLAFFMATPPWHIGSDGVGLFGLIGVSGIATAPIIGRLSDRRSPRSTARIGIGIMLTAFGCFAAFRYSMPGLIAGVIILDAGVQSSLVSNQARIYALSSEAASRLNTVFMTSYFLGGALGSALAGYAWHHFGWNGVCVTGATLLLLAFAPYAKRESPQAA